MKIDKIVDELRKFPTNYSNWQDYSQELKLLKKNAVDSNDEILANWVWVVEQINKIQNEFLSLFNLFKIKDFHESWCLLERIELKLKNVMKLYEFEKDEFGIRQIEKVVSNFQDIFPYRLFISTELYYKEINCSICDAKISPRNFCGHTKGELYMGEIAHHIVNEVGEFPGIAMVDDPVHKYAVGFPQGEDYDYSLVEKTLDKLSSPFDDWEVKIERKIIPWKIFYSKRKRKRQLNDEIVKCPCKSGLRFETCCKIRSDGIVSITYKFKFSK